jgi:hypothetical protein
MTSKTDPNVENVTEMAKNDHRLTVQETPELT